MLGVARCLTLRLFWLKQSTDRTYKKMLHALYGNLELRHSVSHFPNQLSRVYQGEVKKIINSLEWDKNLLPSSFTFKRCATTESIVKYILNELRCEKKNVGKYCSLFCIQYLYKPANWDHLAAFSFNSNEYFYYT